MIGLWQILYRCWELWNKRLNPMSRKEAKSSQITMENLLGKSVLRVTKTLNLLDKLPAAMFQSFSFLVELL